MLGGISYDGSGRIVGARSVYMKWMGRMNSTIALEEGGSNTEGTGEMVSKYKNQEKGPMSSRLFVG